MTNPKTSSSPIQERQLGTPPEDLAGLKKENDGLRRKVERLSEELERLNAKRFGRSSEQLGQLGLFEAGDPPKSARPEKQKIAYERDKPKKGHGRGGFAEHLPRTTIEIDPPAEERFCECCTKDLVRIRTEVMERGTVIPSRVEVNQYRRGVWACVDGCSAPKTASLPSSVVSKAKWEPSAYAHVVVSKYADHQPLHRQMDIFRRSGVHFPKSTLCDMAMATAAAVKLIVAQICREVLLSSVVLADETPIQVAVNLAGSNPKKRKFKTGYLWVFRTPDGQRVAFDFTTSRSRAGPIEFLGEWIGTLVTDEYSGYDEVCRSNGITRAACWVHARRRFKDALESRPTEAAIALQIIANLYRVETAIARRIRRREEVQKSILSDEARAQICVDARDRWSRPLVETLREHLLRWREDRSIVPKSLIGKAVRYMLPEAPRHEIWNRFTVFLDDGRVPLDNNGSENSIRPVVVGRKNWLVAGSVRGGDAAAGLYSLMLTCRALKVDTMAYLSDILSRLDTDTPEALTPWAWKAEQAAQSAIS